VDAPNSGQAMTVVRLMTNLERAHSDVHWFLDYEAYFGLHFVWIVLQGRLNRIQETWG
jgi:hypothetical protein